MHQWTGDGRLQERDLAVIQDRVAQAVAGAEVHHQEEWRQRFRAILSDFRFLPGGRIMAAAGIDLSTLRPAGSPSAGSGGIASGPVSFMGLWEAAGAVLESGNLRCGAMMAALRCDHPDIEGFIEAKCKAGALAHFNLSVLITDSFMRALADDSSWALVFPVGAQAPGPGAEVCERVWSGGTVPQACRVHRRMPARRLWEKILQAQHASCEPGVLFVDHISDASNIWYCGRVVAASPGGEVPLPAYAGCNLGAINLSRFVHHPVAGHPAVDFEGIRAVSCIATRFLDNVHDISPFAFKVQEDAARASRRLGLGVTGLADMFAMLGLRYGSAASLELTRNIMKTIHDEAYRTSIGLAAEKGAFPAFDKIRFASSASVQGLSPELQQAMAAYGIRNSHLLALVPAGAISVLADPVSSGIEPILCLDGERGGGPPGHRIEAADADAQAQLNMMAAAQPYVDSAIAKTVHLPASATPQDLERILLRAWELGLKGCAICRDGSTTGAVAGCGWQ